MVAPNVTELVFEVVNTGKSLCSCGCTRAERHLFLANQGISFHTLQWNGQVSHRTSLLDTSACSKRWCFAYSAALTLVPRPCARVPSNVSVVLQVSTGNQDLEETHPNRWQAARTKMYTSWLHTKIIITIYWHDIVLLMCHIMSAPHARTAVKTPGNASLFGTPV